MLRKYERRVGGERSGERKGYREAQLRRWTDMTHEHLDYPKMERVRAKSTGYWLLKPASVYPCSPETVSLDSFIQQVMSTYCVQRSGLDFGSTSIKETDKNSALV